MTDPRGPRDDRYAKGSLRGKRKTLIGNPVMGRKFCRDCGKWRHLIDFTVRTRTAGGAPVYWYPSCKACVRVYNRRFHSDPERLARRRAYDREAKTAKRREQGIEPRRFKEDRVDNGSGWLEVDNAPLRAAFEESGLTVQEVARRAGWLRGNEPDGLLVKRRLGLIETDGKAYERLSYDNAVKLAKALDIDPVSVGV